MSAAPNPAAKPITTLPETEESQLTSLQELNKRYVYVRQMAQIVRIPTLTHPDIDPYHPTVFVNSLEAKQRKIAQKWVGWNHRREVYKLAYEPGQPTITPSGNLNTWIPSPILPKRGDITLWNDYLTRVFKPDPTYRDWFLAWLAYPRQHPGAKLHTACIFWSEQTATGKSMMGRIMSHIYGSHNYAQINESTLHGTFNHWAAGREFIMGEEIRGTNSERHADTLKAMITQDRVFVNIKNRAHYELRDCLNYYFTSNHPAAMYLDENDRRFFVHNVGSEKYPADKYRDEFEPWANSGGYAAISHYLQNEVDLSKPIIGGDPNSLNPRPFNPGAAAPLTAARALMVQNNKDDAAMWVDELLHSPDSVLCDTGWTLASATELYGLFLKAYPHSRIARKTFTTRLRERIPAVYSDNEIVLSPRRKMKLYPCVEETRPVAGTLMADIIRTYLSEEHLNTSMT